MNLSELLATIEDNTIDATALASRGNNEVVHCQHFYIWGLRRSGNHAVINWIEGMVPDHHEFVNFNDLSPFQNPWRRAWQYSRKPGHRRTQQLQQYPLYRDMHDDIVRSEARGQHRHQELAIFSFEDYAPRLAYGRYFRTFREVRYGAASRCKVILIIRDPFNLLASRLAHHRLGTGRRKSSTSWLPFWKEYARLCVAPPDEHTIPINFDRWLISEVYRREVADALDLSYNEHNFYKMSSIGGGSSFDGWSDRDVKNHHRLLERWRECDDHRAITALHDDVEVRHYMDALFSDIPGLPSTR